MEQRAPGLGLGRAAGRTHCPCSHSLQEKNPEQEPIPLVLRETIAHLQAHGECPGPLGKLPGRVCRHPH